MERLLKMTWIGVIALCGCGGDGGGGGRECPPDYPVERDGYCYREDGGVMPGMDSGPSDTDSGPSGDTDSGGGDVDSGPMPGTDSGPAGDGGGVICTGMHPLVEGMRRYCNTGDCYCAMPDACFPMDIADACCPGPIVCETGDSDAGPGVICTGMHPLVEGSRRYCNMGDCYCADPDNCYPMDIADPCCPGAITCY